MCGSNSIIAIPADHGTLLRVGAMPFPRGCSVDLLLGLVLIDAVDADDLAGLDAHLRWSVSWGAVNPDW